MRSRRACTLRYGRRACMGAAGVAAVGLLAGACSAEVAEPRVTDPVVTAAAMETLAPRLRSPTTASDETEAPAAVTSSSAATSTTGMPVPTSTWVFFEEVEEPPPPKVIDTVRVPQTAGDDKGAMYWYRGSSLMPADPPRRFEHAGEVFDSCRVEDAYFDSNRRFPATDGDLADYSKRWFLRSGGIDCRGAELARSRPLWGFRAERYFTFDDDGRQSDYVASQQEALEWYREHSWSAAESQENTLPAGASPAGTIGVGDRSGSSLLQIRYSDAVGQVDEVRVLPDTVSVGADGALRGLVRNWSRDLWAYGTVVGAGGREWAWPLSIQPGELAPFEISDWGGPGDPGLIEFEVVAEMSNDADLSRAWWPRWSDDYYDYLTGSMDGAEPDAFPYVFVRLYPISHPSLGGEWASDLRLDLAVYLAELTSEGSVVEVAEIGFHESGPQRDIADLGDTGPRVLTFYPRPEYWAFEVGSSVDVSAMHSFGAWIGIPHPRADR